MSKNKQFAVLGLGRFGQSVARTLAESGYDVLACDNDIETVQEVSQYATHAVQADVMDSMAMSALGLGNFDVVVVAIGGDLEPSVMATMLAKESGVKHVIAKASNQTQKRILEKVGADRVVLPETEMGVKIATGLISSNIIDFINLSDEYGIAEIEPLPQWVGQTLHKANIRAMTGINIVAIKRGKRIIVSPKPDETIAHADVLVAMGENRDIHRLEANAKPSGGLFRGHE